MDHIDPDEPTGALMDNNGSSWILMNLYGPSQIIMGAN